jgi:hypothetical protein
LPALERYPGIGERRQRVERQRDIDGAQLEAEEMAGGAAPPERDDDQDETERADGEERRAHPPGHPAGARGRVRSRDEGQRGSEESQDREPGEQAAFRVVEREEPAAIERAEGAGIEPRQEIHPERVGERLRTVEAERLVDGDVGREERGEGERERRGPQRAPPGDPPAGHAGPHQHAPEPHGDQQEPVRERVIERREALAPQGDHEDAEVTPARPVEEAEPGPETHRQEKTHLDHGAVEVLETIRKEGEDDAGHQARERAPREGPRERRGEEAAQREGGEHHDVGREERGAGRGHDRRREKGGHEDRLPERLRVGVRIEELGVEELARGVEELMGRPADQGGLARMVALTRQEQRAGRQREREGVEDGGRGEESRRPGRDQRARPDGARGAHGRRRAGRDRGPGDRGSAHRATLPGRRLPRGPANARRSPWHSRPRRSSQV